MRNACVQGIGTPGCIVVIAVEETLTVTLITTAGTDWGIMRKGVHAFFQYYYLESRCRACRCNSPTRTTRVYAKTQTSREM